MQAVPAQEPFVESTFFLVRCIVDSEVGLFEIAAFVDVEAGQSGIVHVADIDQPARRAVMKIRSVVEHRISQAAEGPVQEMGRNLATCGAVIARLSALTGFDIGRHHADSFHEGWEIWSRSTNISR